VLTLSNTTGVGLGAVRKLFEPGKTYCLLGASGVGKTSLINALVGEEDRYFTLPVRDSDGKGIHTTTWRELIVLENGALVIDTPGMRELGHLDSANGIQDTFDDITALESACRFRDCTHGPRAKECAVRVAAETGELSAERLANFLRMKEEASAGARALREQRWKNR
jgi:ribosome biogenesis GTPase